MGAAGAAGVAGPHDLLACGDNIAETNGEVRAVAVRPAVAFVVEEGQADAARFTAGAVPAAAFGPPVVWPLAHGDDAPGGQMYPGVVQAS